MTETILPPALDIIDFRAQRAVEWAERRDEAIRAAHLEGFSLRSIALAAGLSHTTVATIVKRAS